MHGQQFHAIPQELTLFQASKFVLLHPNAFLCAFDHEPRSMMNRSSLIISGDDMQQYNLFRKHIDAIRSVVPGLLKGKRGEKAADDVDSD
jgi:hypothetical protein